MACRLRIAKTAQAQFDGIVDYLANKLKSPSAAENFVTTFDYQAHLVRDQPYIHSLSFIEELAERNYRSFRVNKYVVLYRVEDDVVYIAHIFHQSQDYAHLV